MRRVRNWEMVKNNSPVSIAWVHADKTVEVYWSGSGYSFCVEDENGNLVFRSKLYESEREAVEKAVEYMQTA